MIPTCANVGLGVLGVAVDPNFSSNGFVYLNRTVAGAGGCASATDRFDQVIRIQLVANSYVSGSLTELLTGIRTDKGDHNGGTVLIGPDQKLYVSTGDTGLGDDPGPPGSSTNPYAQDLGALEGKVLRLELDGTPAAGNPFIGQPGARGEIFASGFRNPFRFGFDPQSGALWLGDVGQDTLEEVDIVASGGNYAWPRCEGPLPAGCEQPGDVDPVFTYPHTGTGALGASVTGGAFADSHFGAFAGNYFFGDYIANKIYSVALNGARDGIAGSPSDFDVDASTPVNMVFAPDGALYYVSISAGEVRRVFPSCGGVPATIVGTPGNDTLTGTAGNDVIVGHDGNDTISGLSGNDKICGGPGNDALVGGDGNDSLTGESGDDTLNGGNGADVLSGLAGTDTATYATRTGGVTADIDGVADDGNGSDGPAGARDNVKPDIENLVGGSGADTLTGSAAANTLDGRNGADVLNGLGGTDTATYTGRSSGVTADIDGVADDGNGSDGPAGARDNIQTDIENLTGGKADDTLTGSAANNTLDGGLGPDILSGLAGTHTVSYATRASGVTADIDGVADDGNGSDGPAGARDNVMTDVEGLIGGSGADTLTGSSLNNRLTGGLGADTLMGLIGNDNLFANDGLADAAIDCDGGAADTAHVNAGDPATVGCETVGP